jgi:hypothetical protein
MRCVAALQQHLSPQLALAQPRAVGAPCAAKQAQQRCTQLLQEEHLLAMTLVLAACTTHTRTIPPSERLLRGIAGPDFGSFDVLISRPIFKNDCILAHTMTAAYPVFDTSPRDTKRGASN